MATDTDASAARDLFEAAGVAGGVVLITPVAYRVLANAVDLLGASFGLSVPSEIVPDGPAAAASVLALFSVSVAASLPLARYSLRGPSAVRGGRSAVSLVPIVALLAVLLALAFLAVDGFLGVLRWGVSKGDTAVAALGLLGLLSIVWIAVRSGKAFLDGIERSR